MTDPHRRGSGQDEPYQYGYPGYTDPAYANPEPNPTRKLPPYEYAYDPYTTGAYGQPYQAPPDEPPPGPPSRRWLWVLATVSVVTVLGLIIAVVVIDSSSQQTVVAPAPSVQPSETASPTTTSRTPTTTSRPRTTVAPIPPSQSETTTPGAPDPSNPPGETQTVVYDVGGDGRAISITYVDTGGVLQTEFNVMLPWSRQVELTDADAMASINIVNFGREITCTITVAGDEVESQTGAGLTFCGALG